jgi:hypothetical protein
MFYLPDFLTDLNQLDLIIIHENKSKILSDVIYYFFHL